MRAASRWGSPDLRRVVMSKAKPQACADLLIELGCEELPPKSLASLGKSLFSAFSAQLEKAGFEFDSNLSHFFYTPRRLALQMSAVAARQPDQVLERRGPAVAAAYDAENKATPAAIGFARSVGKQLDELETVKTDKGEWLYCRIEKPGEPLQDRLFPMLEKALAGLPVAKPMRWADNTFSFVRPVHWLVVLHGQEVVDGWLFGLQAGRFTRGHRVHSPGPHEIDTATNYQQVLESAYVLADQDKRKGIIEQQAIALGEKAGGKALINSSLLEEVTNLVEWPHSLLGSFDNEFLDVPAEALVASMQDHQKFFPVTDLKTGSLLARFITVANLESTDFSAVQAGFERVIRPRLADARFFWEQDNKRPIENWLPLLDRIVFQNKLGSVGDKSKRIASISKKIAEEISIDASACERAACLCKCDLVSQMVGEFPELQGTMGRYYALQSGEDKVVALAIGEHYLPAFSGDRLPTHEVAKVVALADRLDTLAGIFATGLKPSGNKDPFALRRAALGVVRLLLDGEILIELDRVLAISALVIEDQLALSADAMAELRHFILERLRHYLREQGYATNLISAALDAPLGTLPDLSTRLAALQAFMLLDVSAGLVEANKRISNILRKSEQTASGVVDDSLFVIDEEGRLFTDINNISTRIDAFFKGGDYRAALEQLAALSPAIDAFFEHVMVMDEDSDVRLNRLSLLCQLKGLFDRVANLALIA